MERYEQDPDRWMRQYFQNTINNVTRRHGPHRGRALADKIVRDGLLVESDVPPDAGG